MNDSPTRPLKVFLCHASADKPAVRKLYRYLRSKGVDPWLDAEKLLPGENWEVEIPKAIFDSDVILVCLSKNSINKEGYVQKEIVFALDKAMEKPEGTIFIVPAKLEECDVPQRLNRYQWVDLYRDGYKRLMMSLNKRAAQLGLDVGQASISNIIKRAERERIEKEAVAKADLEMIEEALNESTERIAAQKASLPVLLEEKKEKQELPFVIKISEGQSKEKKKNQKSSISPVSNGVGGEVQHPTFPEHKRNFPVASARLSFTIFLIIFIVWGGIKVWNNLLSPSTPTPLPTQTSQPAEINISSHTEAPISPTFQSIQANTPSSTGTPVLPTPVLSVGSTMIGKDGMTLLYVPAGEFTMGSDNAYSDEKPVHKLTLDAFWIDQTEVTVRMYYLCVEASVCKEPTSKKSYSHPSYYGNAEYDNYPVIYVDWNMAKTYCEWVGRRLPTEAEWEKAARGTDGNIYPWGNTFDGTLVNFCDKNCRFNWADKSFDDKYADVAPVGSYPHGKSIYGALDMAGNVWEWVSSLYQPYPYNPTDGREDLTSSDSRVLRGGSWNYSDFSIRSASRGRYVPSASNVSGFRCVRSQ